MNTITQIPEEAIRSALKTITDPYLGLDLLSANVLKIIQMQEDIVELHFKFGYPLSSKSTYAKSLRDDIQTVLRPILGNVVPHIKIDWKVNQHLAQAGIKAVPSIKNII